MSTPAFPYDVFLSHSAKDKVVVRPLAERLRKDGLKVWFDEWVLKPGDSIPAKIEAWLRHSRFTIHPSAFILQPFLSGSLAQFLYINWLPAALEREDTVGRGDEPEVVDPFRIEWRRRNYMSS